MRRRSSSASLDFWLTAGPETRGVREGARALHRPPPRAARQLRLVGEPRSRSRALTSPKLGDRRLRPGRRGHHRRRRLPDDGHADRPERPRARSSSTSTLPTYNVDVDAARGGAARDAHAGDHDRPHARQPVRPRRGHGVLPRARPVARRGQLRRARLDLRRPPRRHFGDLATLVVLPRAPHHDGRGRRGAHATGRAASRSSSRSATGAATAGARPAARTPAASASPSSSATCRTATTTSTSTGTSATT